jgi:perosamine synthetase
MRYPVYIPQITEDEKRLVNDCLESTWISSKGKYIEKFESEVAKYTGAKYAVALSNGTVALHLALLANEIGPGDEVIVPDLTYIATANAVLYVQATPIIVDVDPKTWNITAASISANITAKTKAIIVADIYGTPCDMDKIQILADNNNLILIEDAAESIGAKYNNRMAGNLGNVGTLSFFGNKTITTGEGGMVLTNNPSIDHQVRKLRNQGNSETVRYRHDVLGYNYRMTNIQAAIGVAQMMRIEDILDKKRLIQKWYEDELQGIVTFQKIYPKMSSSYWMVSILLDSAAIRNSLMSHLDTAGIETRPFFNPISSMPYYVTQENKIAYLLSERGMNLPSYPALTKTDVNYICNIIKEHLTE